MKLNKKQLKEVRKFAERIQPVYKLLKWDWGYKGIPSVEGIEKCILELFSSLNKNSTWVRTGGLFVQRETDESGDDISFGFEDDVHFYEV